MSDQTSDSGSQTHASQNDNVRWNFILEFCDAEDRPTYIGLTNTLLAPVVTIAPLVGAFLVTKLGYQPMFAVVAIISAIGGAMLLFWVVEPRRISTFDSGTDYGS